MSAKYLVIVEGDTNDGDYVTRNTEIIEGDIALIKLIADALKSSKKGHNWENGVEYREYSSIEELYEGILQPDQIEMFDEGYVPTDPQGLGIHTNIDIRLIKIEEDIVLFRK